ncbi:hypothetical protein PEBR_35441 [Penicillium brasilianum]|uniref:Xylanolytic transcriptional activator regulatory domain-containing protein n=1 Tax=Penicillium brasilianum TaxID=104259 RepID=A0A1S9RDP8_PENBI|nr:hypothetical protein PEBR_35441 [Penicillium brasilianum]
MQVSGVQCWAALLDRIRELEARLALYESSGLQCETGRSDIESPSTRTVSSPQITGIVAPPDSEHPVQRITTERDIGSSQDFGNRVQTLFEQRSVESPAFIRQPCKSTRESLFPSERPILKLKQTLGASYPVPNLPSEEEAYQLLHHVLFYFGETQHLFDARDASDQLAIIYENPQESLQNPSIGFLQALLIFALGKLLRGDLDGSSSPPGFALFTYALDLLPCPSELRAHGVAGIEVLAIITVYLQNIDRRDDAASYIGLAIRLAMLHRLHRKQTFQKLRRSEATHASRLWWTVHMQDKRSMILNGCPLALDDKFVDTFLPTEAPGFPNPFALQINLEVAQIQTRIYSVIYSQESCPKDEFVAGVQDIISALNQLANQIAQGYGFSGALLNQQASKKDLRLSISLYTILYQSIILTLRPIVLHLTKAILSGETTFTNSGNAFQQLTCTCIEAARRSLELMVLAQKEDMIAKFGFFDLDAIFSAGFIMLLAAIVASTNNSRGHHLSFLKPTPGILESLQLLDFLAGYHNEAAKARRDQIQRLYDHIPALVESLQIETGSGGNGQSPFGSSSSQAVQTPLPTGANTSNRHPPLHVQTWDPESGRDMMDSYTASLPMPFPSDAQTMYSLYQGDDFVLTGADVADFEELQRHLLGSDIAF